VVRELSRYSDSLRSRVPTSPGASPAYCTKGIGTLPVGKVARALIIHPYLASWLKKEQEARFMLVRAVCETAIVRDTSMFHVCII
jgi:hypothetical protein